MEIGHEEITGTLNLIKDAFLMQSWLELTSKTSYKIDYWPRNLIPQFPPKRTTVSALLHWRFATQINLAAQFGRFGTPFKKGL